MTVSSFSINMVSSLIVALPGFASPSSFYSFFSNCHSCTALSSTKTLISPRRPPIFVITRRKLSGSTVTSKSIWSKSNLKLNKRYPGSGSPKYTFLAMKSLSIENLLSYWLLSPSSCKEVPHMLLEV